MRHKRFLSTPDNKSERMICTLFAVKLLLISGGQSMESDIEKQWDEYVEKFNLLSDQISQAGIDVNNLVDVIKSYDKYIRLSEKQKVS